MNREVNFDPKRLLPSNIRIDSAETHLYRIGLSLFPNGIIKRNRFHNPILIFIIQIYLIIKSIISLLINGEDSDIFIIIGDYGYFLGLKLHVDIVFIFVTSISLVSQLIHYYNYKNDIKPSYLKPFEMISGLISPKSIGLTDEKEIYKIIKISKILFKSRVYLVIAISSAVFIGSLITFISFTDDLFLIIGSLHSLLYGIAGYFMYTIIYQQLIYFYIICYYFKSKLKFINDNMRQISKERRIGRNNFDFYNTIQSLNGIYSEISNYNNNYWSKFLLSVWILLSIIISSVTYCGLFGKIGLILQIVCLYTVLVFTSILIFIITTASSINLEANKSYRLLNSLMSLKIRLLPNNRIKVLQNIISLIIV